MQLLTFFATFYKKKITAKFEMSKCFIIHHPPWRCQTCTKWNRTPPASLYIPQVNACNTHTKFRSNGASYKWCGMSSVRVPPLTSPLTKLLCIYIIHNMPIPSQNTLTNSHLSSHFLNLSFLIVTPSHSKHPSRIIHLPLFSTLLSPSTPTSHYCVLRWD